MKTITPQQVYEWLGSDTTLSDALQLLAEIANGEYIPEDLRSDVIDYQNQ